MTASTAVAPLPAKRMAMVWAITVVLVFLVLVLLGLVMRLNQAAAIALSPDRFYAVMTLHGLGMAGTLFIGGLAAIAAAPPTSPRRGTSPRGTARPGRPGASFPAGSGSAVSARS